MFHKLQQKATQIPENLLLVLSVFTGTFFIYRDFGIRMIFGFGFLCLILLMHLIQRITRDRPPLVQPVHLPYLVLAVVILVNFLRPDSRHDADSVSYILSMLISCSMVLLALPDAREGLRSLKVLYWSGLLLAAFVVFFVVFEDLFWDTLYPLLTPVAQEYLLFFVPGGYAITLGGCTYTNHILFFGIAACCGFLCSSKWSRKHILMLLSCGFILLALLLVGRRGELLGALVCCALLVLAMCPPRRRKQLLLAGIILAVAGISLVLLFLPQLKQISALERYILTIENLLQGQDITSGRLTLYQIAFRAFREHPIAGIGWDQFYTLVPQEYLADRVVLIEDVHCIYLQFLCETGILSAPLIVAPLVYYYVQVCAQFRRLKHRAAESRELALAFNLSVNSFMIQSFLLFVGIYDPNFQRIIFWCFYSLSILLMIAALRLEGHRPADPVSRMMERFLTPLAPLGTKLWAQLQSPWKEGK